MLTLVVKSDNPIFVIPHSDAESIVIGGGTTWQSHSCTAGKKPTVLRNKHIKKRTIKINRNPNFSTDFLKVYFRSGSGQAKINPFKTQKLDSPISKKVGFTACIPNGVSNTNMETTNALTYIWFFVFLSLTKASF